MPGAALLADSKEGPKALFLKRPCGACCLCVSAALHIGEQEGRAACLSIATPLVMRFGGQMAFSSVFEFRLHAKWIAVHKGDITGI